MPFGVPQRRAGVVEGRLPLAVLPRSRNAQVTRIARADDVADHDVVEVRRVLICLLQNVRPPFCDVALPASPKRPAINGDDMLVPSTVIQPP